ncbi:MAG: hypothetical protein JNK05_14270 [Myxococcales bacterium]|nr:hypothetical protein [Myxococcales bacterium]
MKFEVQFDVQYKPARGFDVASALFGAASEYYSVREVRKHREAGLNDEIASFVRTIDDDSLGGALEFVVVALDRIGYRFTMTLESCATPIAIHGVLVDRHSHVWSGIRAVSFTIAQLETEAVAG